MIKVMRIEVGSYASNCYLVWDDESKEGVIIDPGAEADNILANLDKAGFKDISVEKKRMKPVPTVCVLGKK